MVLGLLLLALLQEQGFRSAPGDDAWIWPLSGDVYEPRRLLNTYGQYVGEKGKSPDRLHGAIDIQAACEEEVRAVADGVVVSLRFQDVGSFNNFVVVSPEKGDPWGVSYEHLATIRVDYGDRVRRGEILGTVHEWTGANADYRHLHLGLVDTSGLIPCCKDGCKLAYLDNPLPLLSRSSDDAEPVFGSPAVLFFPDVEAVSPVTVTDPSNVELEEGKVSMAARVHDYFPDSPVSAVSIFKVAPVRVGVAVRRWVGENVFDPFGVLGHLELVYSNEIEFLGPLEESAKLHLYRRETYTESTDSSHDLYFDLCNTPQEKKYWDAAEGDYRIEVTAEDASGNIAWTVYKVSVKKP